MDAFHKVLARIYQITGGRDSVEVDIADLLKKEGYYPSLNDILSHLKSEGWVTESRQNIVNITHWGVAEARKGESARPEAARTIERESKKMLAAARDLGVVIEEFIADPVKSKFAPVEKKLSEMRATADNVRSAL